MVQINSLKNALMVLAFLCWTAAASAEITFKFAANSIGQSAIKTTMERNISALLSEIDRAGRSGSALNLAGIDMEPGAKNRLLSFWKEAATYTCDKPRYISRCLNDVQGYQVRSIPVTITPAKESSYSEDLNRELTVSLNRAGRITGVRLAYGLNEGLEQMLQATGTGGVEEEAMRLEILKWVEDFRCYYNERNLNALKQIYSDDAIIITGSVMRRPERNVDGKIHFREGVTYKVQTRDQYINRLDTIFRKRTRINVEFDHIAILKHGTKPHIFGVTLHQKWQNGAYKDDGTLFLLWDFSDRDRPKIHVRTWQSPDDVKQDGVFTLYHFDI